MYYIQFSSGLTSFKSIFIKPYFRSEDTYNIKLDKLKGPIKLDKLEVPIKLDELEVPIKLDKLEVPAKLNKLEVPLSILEVL